MKLLHLYEAHEQSPAAKEAKAKGLISMGFGRYGKNGKVTHTVVNGKLTPHVGAEKEQPKPLIRHPNDDPYGNYATHTKSTPTNQSIEPSGGNYIGSKEDAHRAIPAKKDQLRGFIAKHSKGNIEKAIEYAHGAASFSKQSMKKNIDIYHSVSNNPYFAANHMEYIQSKKEHILNDYADWKAAKELASEMDREHTSGFDRNPHLHGPDQ